MKFDGRRLKILEAVVDEYIKTGEPVGSKYVAAALGHSVSSATIRNDMAALEQLGFLEQPHASAGRVPTYLGYRLYIGQLMTPTALTEQEKHQVQSMIAKDNFTANAVVENALDALVEITGCAAINASAMPKFSIITRVEVIPAGRRLYALLLITSSGEIKNKICRLEFDLTHAQLLFFANLIDREVTGIKVEQLTPAVLQNLAVALGSYMMSLSPLLYAVYELSNQLAKRNVEIKGEAKLLSYADFNANELIQFISTKNELATILTDAFDGINVVFGKENDKFTITNSSLILSKYSAGEAQGSLGIIGPIRLDYAKVIPYIEYFSESISKMIDGMIDDKKKGEPNGDK